MYLTCFVWFSCCVFWNKLIEWIEWMTWPHQWSQTSLFHFYFHWHLCFTSILLTSLFHFYFHWHLCFTSIFVDISVSLLFSLTSLFHFYFHWHLCFTSIFTDISVSLLFSLTSLFHFYFHWHLCFTSIFTDISVSLLFSLTSRFHFYFRWYLCFTYFPQLHYPLHFHICIYSLCEISYTHVLCWRRTTHHSKLFPCWLKSSNWRTHRWCHSNSRYLTMQWHLSCQMFKPNWNETGLWGEQWPTGGLNHVNNHCPNIRTYHLQDMWLWFVSTEPQNM